MSPELQAAMDRYTLTACDTVRRRPLNERTIISAQEAEWLGRMSMSEGPVHILKTHPEPFAAVWRGDKYHELRKNDRPGGFTLQDLLVLREWDPEHNKYLGPAVFAVPTYITPGGKFGLPDDMVVMSIRVVAKHRNWVPSPPGDGS
jgi:hypothetical protein